MSDWDILGIAPTDDLREIKRAYAKALRIHHPEKDPEGFQKLRAAYERLQASSELPRKLVLFADAPNVEDCTPPAAGTASPESTSPPERTAWAPAPPSDPTSPPAPARWPPAPPAPREEVLYTLQEEWKSLWNRYDRRESLEAWKEFLGRAELWDLQTKREFGWFLLTFLQEAFLNGDLRLLPRQAWLLLDRSFDWHAQELELSRRLDDAFLDQLLFQIRTAGAESEPGSYPLPRRPRPVADPIPLPEHRTFEQFDPEAKRGHSWVWFLVVVAIAIFRAISHHSTPTEEPYEPRFTSGATPASLTDTDRQRMEQEIALEAAKATFARENGLEDGENAAGVERISMDNWNDERGGLLRGYCGNPDLDATECPESQQKGVRFRNRRGELELQLVVGGKEVSHLTTQQSHCQKLRLCQLKGRPRQLVGLVNLASPCNTHPDKVWEIQGKKLVPVAPSKAICSQEPRCEQELVCRE